MQLVFGNCGVLQLKDLNNKAYVEMSTIDPETSTDIGEGIKQCNGRYLEAQIHGSRQEAADGMLIILAGGDRSVFEECHSCFKTIAKNTFFLGSKYLISHQMGWCGLKKDQFIKFYVVYI